MKAVHGTNGFTLEQFREWLKEQPEEREFNYLKITDCLVASFLKEYFSEKNVSVASHQYRLAADRPVYLPIPLEICQAFRAVLDHGNIFTIAHFKKHFV